MKQIIDRKLYDTEKSKLVASDRYWDGSNWERHGRNIYLYKTNNGRYFSLYTTQWQGERDNIEALTIEEAKRLYEELPEHDLDYAVAFGDEPEEA